MDVVDERVLVEPVEDLELANLASESVLYTLQPAAVRVHLDCHVLEVERRREGVLIHLPLPRGHVGRVDEVGAQRLAGIWKCRRRVHVQSVDAELLRRAELGQEVKDRVRAGSLAGDADALAVAEAVLLVLGSVLRPLPPARPVLTGAEFTSIGPFRVSFLVANGHLWGLQGSIRPVALLRTSVEPGTGADPSTPSKGGQPSPPQSTSSEYLSDGYSTWFSSQSTASRRGRLYSPSGTPTVQR